MLYWSSYRNGVAVPILDTELYIRLDNIIYLGLGVVVLGVLGVFALGVPVSYWVQLGVLLLTVVVSWVAPRFDED
jgi:hypothetical protein